MQRHTGERGAALILLIGITAALAILTAALVMLLVNQQGATANERTTKTSLYYAEGALDSALNAIKATTASGTNFPIGPPGIDTSQVNTQYLAAYPPPAPTPTYRVYDNAATIDASTPAYDASGPAGIPDYRVWVEATVTYQGHTSRLRQMLTSDTRTSILPQSALYADTDIVASGTSDIYAVNKDWTFYASGVPPYVTSIMAGGDFTGNSSTNLAPPTGTRQSLGINVNGSVSLPGITENGVTIGGVGLLSDYFDQGRQYNLTTLAQTGRDASSALHPDTVAPTAPVKPGTTVASTKFTPANMTSIGATFNSGTKTYTFINSLAVSGNLALNATTFPTGTIFDFKQTLYVTSGTFTVTGNVTVKAATLYVGGALTISGATNTITDNLGALYVTGAVLVSGSSALTTASASTSYTGGNFTHTGPTSPAIADSLGPLYVAGTAKFSGSINVTGADVHTGSGFTITGPTSSSTSVADTFGSLYSIGAIALSGNVVADTTALYTGANFTISGNTANVTDQFGPIYVTGTATWSGGTARLGVQTTTQADPSTANPMYAQILLLDGDTNGNYVSGTGAYDLVLGDVWVDGNAGTGSVAVNFSAPSSGTNSTVMCPLLATTEKTVSNGKVDFGTLTDPMVYYMQCDNDGAYTNTVQWGSSGTFTGLMVVMEAVVQVTGGNDGTLAHSNIVGSLMTGAPVATDITLSNNSTVCYNQAAIENLPAALQSILRTSTTTTVRGTWQQL